MGCGKPGANDRISPVAGNVPGGCLVDHGSPGSQSFEWLNAWSVTSCGSIQGEN
jgi:hypothetical protein